MSQTKEQIELELEAFKNVNPNWMDNKVDRELVASYNSLLVRKQHEHRIEEDLLNITALRDAIIAGKVKETVDCLSVDDSACDHNVTFPVEINAQIVFIREFYPTFWKFFEDEVVADITCPALVLRGPPGIGKSYMAMYFMFKLLREGYTVVYEQVSTGKVFVVPPKGDCRVFFGKATSDLVREFYGPKTVHLFDACANVNNREPYKNNSKLIMFTSPILNGYTQFQRIGAHLLTIPSYTLDEMNKRRAFFPNVSDETYNRKLEIFGHGSIRLVLGLNMERAEELLSDAVSNTTVNNMLDIAEGRGVDVVNGIRGPHALFSTTLAEGADKTDIRSYAPDKVAWNISSAFIMHKLVARFPDDAMLYTAKALKVLERNPGLESTAGYFFEAVAPRWLAKGGEFSVRKLSGSDNNNEDKSNNEIKMEFKEKWPELTAVDAAPIIQPPDDTPTTKELSVSIALGNCSETTSMYLFLRNVTGIHAFHPLTKILQCTAKEKYPVSLSALVAVAKKLPATARLSLYFLVPANRYDRGWQTAQSFAEPEKTDVSESDIKLVQSKLDQYVLRLDVNNPPVSPYLDHSSDVSSYKAGYQPLRGTTRSFCTMVHNNGTNKAVLIGSLNVLHRVLKML